MHVVFRSIVLAWKCQSPVVVDCSAVIRSKLLLQYLEMTRRNGRLGLVSYALLLFGLAGEVPLQRRVIALLGFIVIVLAREWTGNNVARMMNPSDPRSSLAHELLVLLAAAFWALPLFLALGHASIGQIHSLLYCSLVAVAVISISYNSALPASSLLIIVGAVPQMVFLVMWQQPNSLLMSLAAGVCGWTFFARLGRNHQALLKAMIMEDANASLISRLESLGRSLEHKNMELGESLRRANESAHHDALTGLYNRRQLAGLVPPPRSGTSTSVNRVSVCLADIDFFKKVNDQYGHNVGDDVIRGVSRLLQKRLRAGDSVIRYGGEEFVLVLTEHTANQARRFAEGLRKDIGSEAISTQIGPLTVTVSIGLALWAEGEPLAETINRADRAMYRAKRLGRNRVEVDEGDATQIASHWSELTQPVGL